MLRACLALDHAPPVGGSAAHAAYPCQLLRPSHSRVGGSGGRQAAVDMRVPVEIPARQFSRSQKLRRLASEPCCLS